MRLGPTLSPGSTCLDSPSSTQKCNAETCAVAWLLLRDCGCRRMPSFANACGVTACGLLNQEPNQSAAVCSSVKSLEQSSYSSLTMSLLRIRYLLTRR